MPSRSSGSTQAAQFQGLYTTSVTQNVRLKIHNPVSKTLTAVSEMEPFLAVWTPLVLSAGLGRAAFDEIKCMNCSKKTKVLFSV